MTKTFTFALIHFSIAFSITYLLTGDVLIGGLVALIEPAVNTVAFYFHERVWKKLEQRKAAFTPQTQSVQNQKSFQPAAFSLQKLTSEG
ncbi:DUF2061 domain-containing protein [Lacimicrobium alkaliphilum]|uniref:DUF2061 domain-containing protein n=1 Tax=Lacimicrobium alkaliphilum TaxID=1526571 RepID=A0ABQ1RFF6_9ALTE|nr:DUF2061 domain-containing protein [Lacimicrobium alkaliphilum]GGD68767.1 hypothetical protein GCM10011357_24820 [Lacimicrobium alkaliphilum]